MRIDGNGGAELSKGKNDLKALLVNNGTKEGEDSAR